jgi:hypothetical protein
MLIIAYSDTGKPYADTTVEQMARKTYDTYKNLSANAMMTIYVSTENIITAFKMLVAEDYIPHTEIEFRFNDELITVDEFGALNHYPKGFCNVEQDNLFRIFKARRAKIKNEVE